MRLCFLCYVAGILQNFESSGTDNFSLQSEGLTEFKQGSLIVYTILSLWQSDNGISLTNQFALQMTSTVGWHWKTVGSDSRLTFPTKTF